MFLERVVLTISSEEYEEWVNQYNCWLESDSHGIHEKYQRKPIGNYCRQACFKSVL